jgi:predicted transport protein
MPATFHDHYSYTDKVCQPLLNQIRHQVRDFDDKLIETITAKQRIAYSKPNRTIFLEVKVQRRAIVLHMIDVPDPNRILSEVPVTHGWHQLSKRVKIKTADDLKRVLPLIQAAYQRVSLSETKS